MSFKHFEPIDELWKHGGVMWQILHDGTQYDVSTKPMCTNCFYELGDDMRCEECGKQHPRLPNVGESALKASKSYNAARRRKSYTVLAPQVGEKIADVDLDLQNEQFMNVKLENRKGSEQVVITTGKKGDKNKAQIFIDLSKDEIRSDSSNRDPGELITSIELDSGKRNTKKLFVPQGQRKASPSRTLGPSESPPSISLSTNDTELRWATNYHGFGAGFHTSIDTDNFGGDHDYVVNAKLRGTKANGDSWETNVFQFQEMKQPGKPLPIKAGEMANGINLFLSDDTTKGRLTPDLDKDTIRLIVAFRSGKKLELEPYKASDIKTTATLE